MRGSARTEDLVSKIELVAALLIVIAVAAGVAAVLLRRPAQVSNLSLLQTPVVIEGERPGFGPLAFCTERDLDKATQHCTQAQTSFSGCVQTVYVSWPYGNVYAGLRFRRAWFRDDERAPLAGQSFIDVWDGIRWHMSGTYEFTWLNAASLYVECLPPGPYKVELYIEDDLEQIGRFTVEG